MTKTWGLLLFCKLGKDYLIHAVKFDHLNQESLLGPPGKQIKQLGGQ